MRYVIKHTSAEDVGKSVYMTTYNAVMAENHLKAVKVFNDEYPDRVALDVIPQEGREEAYRRYGLGALTKEEFEEYNGRVQESYHRYDREHEEARAKVSAYSLEEFAIEREYSDRRAAEATQNLEGIHVGDIFYTCWGYDQTNYDFYQVVALKGKHTLVLRENKCVSAMCGDYNGYIRPIRDSFRGERAYTVRTQMREYYGKQELFLHINEHSASLIEFGKLYCNSSGA